MKKYDDTNATEILEWRLGTDYRLEKLPRWAQKAMTTMAQDLAYTNQKLAELTKTDGPVLGEVDPYGTPRPFLARPGEHFRVYLQDNRFNDREYVTLVVNADHGLEVRGSRSLVIVPEASNSLVITVADR